MQMSWEFVSVAVVPRLCMRRNFVKWPRGDGREMELECRGHLKLSSGPCEYKQPLGGVRGAEPLQ